MEDLKPFFDKATMEINGMTFKLMKHEDMVGVVALWYGEEYQILATPYLDEIPVAVEVLEVVNDDLNLIDSEGYYGEVNSFEEYVNVVKDIAKKIIDKNKTK